VKKLVIPYITSVDLDGVKVIVYGKQPGEHFEVPPLLGSFLLQFVVDDAPPSPPKPPPETDEQRHKRLNREREAHIAAEVAKALGGNVIAPRDQVVIEPPAPRRNEPKLEENRDPPRYTEDPEPEEDPILRELTSMGIDRTTKKNNLSAIMRIGDEALRDGNDLTDAQLAALAATLQGPYPNVLKQQAFEKLLIVPMDVLYRAGAFLDKNSRAQVAAVRDAQTNMGETVQVMSQTLAAFVAGDFKGGRAVPDRNPADLTIVDFGTRGIDAVFESADGRALHIGDERDPGLATGPINQAAVQRGVAEVRIKTMAELEAAAKRN